MRVTGLAPADTRHPTHTSHELMAAPRVAVVIPCRNEARRLPALLDAVDMQTRPPSEIIVVDDGSTDGSADAARRWAAGHPNVPLRMVSTGGRGAAAAMNAGIAEARADIIVRLDGHCLPEPTYIERSVDILARPRAGIAGGVWRIVPGENTWTARSIAAALSHPLGSGGAGYRNPAPSDGAPRAVDTVPFGTFSRALWVELGGFDEALLRNQDYDFNYRARKSGRDVVLDPSIATVYLARSTFGALARQYFDYGAWKIRMLKKDVRALRVRQLLPMLLLPTLAPLAVWAIAAVSPIAALPIALYIAVNAAGAVHAALRAGEIGLTPGAVAGLVVLQTSWSAGAVSALVRPPR